MFSELKPIAVRLSPRTDMSFSGELVKILDEYTLVNEDQISMLGTNFVNRKFYWIELDLGGSFRYFYFDPKSAGDQWPAVECKSLKEIKEKSGWNDDLKKSQQKRRGKNFLPHDDMKNLWGDNYERKKLIFLSHRATNRSKVTEVKEQLEKKDIACFVAHDDIKPGSKWPDEIIKALTTMDIFIGFVTDDFHQGSWTDQEIGYAYRRDVPRISVKLEKADPKGFISSEQVLQANWDNAAQEIINHLQDVEKTRS